MESLCEQLTEKSTVTILKRERLCAESGSFMGSLSSDLHRAVGFWPQTKEHLPG